MPVMKALMDRTTLILALGRLKLPFDISLNRGPVCSVDYRSADSSCCNSALSVSVMFLD